LNIHLNKINFGLNVVMAFILSIAILGYNSGLVSAFSLRETGMADHAAELNVLRENGGQNGPFFQNGAPLENWSTFMGSSGNEQINGVVLDSSGNIYVAGSGNSGWGSPVRPYTSNSDAFVAKINSEGALVWNTFLGDTGDDYGCGIGLDSSGNVYVTGYSSSSWFSPFRDFSSGNDAFAAKLSGEGELTWNTFLGGSSDDYGYGITLYNNSVYVTGTSKSSWQDNSHPPVRAFTNGRVPEISDAFAAKLEIDDGSIDWNTFMGGQGSDYGYGITVDSSNNIYIAGSSNWSNNSDNWVHGLRDLDFNSDILVVKLNSSGDMLWHTFLGGLGYDYGYGITGDNSSVYVTGASNAVWSQAGTAKRGHSGLTDAFAAKLGSNGGLTWYTFLGAGGYDYGQGITLDSSSNIYIAGYSPSSWQGDSSPVRAHYDSTSSNDAFAAKLSGTGVLTWNTFLGGSGDDRAYGIAVNGTGSKVYLGGNSDVDWGNPVSAYTGGADGLAVELEGDGSLYSCEISLEGNSTAIADEDASPSETDHTDFGTALIHTGPVTRTFTIRNTGAADLRIFGTPAISGTNAADFAVTDSPASTVPVSGSTTFNVTFAPLAEDLRTAVVSIVNTDADENPYEFTIQGTGKGVPDIGIYGNSTHYIPDENSLYATEDFTDFGPAALNIAVPRTFTLKNNGYGALTLTGHPLVAISGTNEGDFSVTAEPSTPVAINGGSTTFKIAFQPSGEGYRYATVSIANDDPDGTYNFAIRGTGTASSNPEISLKGNSIVIADDDSSPTADDGTDFGTANIATETVTHTFTIANESSTDILNLNGNPVVEVTGNDAADFSITQPSTSVILPSGSITFQVKFTPLDSGIRTAVITLNNDDQDENPYNFTVQGRGSIPANTWNTFMGSSKKDETYAVAVDSLGNVYLTGYSTASWGSPVRSYTPSDYPDYYDHAYDAFVAKLDRNGQLIWNTFLGSGAYDGGYGIAVDGSGVYVVGYSMESWGSNPVRSYSASYDAFVARLDNNGNLIWNTFLGNDMFDYGYGIAIDSSNVYVTGFSLTSWQGSSAPVRAMTSYDAFAAKLSKSNGSLTWNTFLGSSDNYNDAGNAITVDGSGNIFVAGYSPASWQGSNPPARAYTPQSGSSSDQADKYDAFVAKLNNDGFLLWNTFLGGDYLDQGNGIAADSSGNVYVGGYSKAAWETTKRAYTAGYDGFAAKLDGSNGSLVWNTFLGGPGDEQGDEFGEYMGKSLAVDSSGNLYASGFSSAAWNAGGAPIRDYTAGQDAYVAKLDSSGDFSWLTFLGGEDNDLSYGLAVDVNTNIYTGGSSKAEWGTPIVHYTPDKVDALAVKLNSAGEMPVYEPEMSVEGNSREIVNGSNTPSADDYTDFGSTAVTEGSLTRTFTIKNSGPGALLLPGNPVAAINGTNKDDFEVTTQPSTSLGPLVSYTTFEIKFVPSGSGLRKAAVSIANNDSDENPYTFDIQGTGVLYPEIGVEGNLVEIANGDTNPWLTDHTDFGPAAIIGKATRTFTIKNTGPVDLTLPGDTPVTISGPHAGDFTIAAQPSSPVTASTGSTTFTIDFAPSEEGIRAATVSIANSDFNENPYTFDIKGTGTVAPEMSVEGNSKTIADGDDTPSAEDHTDFGPTVTAFSSVTRTFTIKNSGTDKLTLSGNPRVAIGGPDAGDFYVIAQPSSPVAAYTGSTTFEVDFIPAGAGTRTASISIVNDDSDENPYNFTIQGTGPGAITDNTWNTFLGGNGEDGGTAAAVDIYGNVYVTGSCTTTWQGSQAPVRGYTSGTDVFVAKLDSSGSLLWNTFLGGNGEDNGYCIAVDSSGNIYVGGSSDASWEDTKAPVHGYTDGIDAFAAGLDNDGKLIWNTFMDNSGDDVFRSMLVDSNGNIFAGGETYNGFYDIGFAVKMNNSGSLTWITPVNVWDYGLDWYGAEGKSFMDMDGSGNIYVVSSDNAYWDGTPVQEPIASGQSYDVAVIKLNNNGIMVWFSFMGGSGDDFPCDVDVDSSGNVFVTGNSTDAWSSNKRGYSGSGDAFAAKMDTNGLTVWNTLLGGGGIDDGKGIRLDSNGNIYVTGSSSETWQGDSNPVRLFTSGIDAFAAKLDSSGQLAWNTFLGSSENDEGNGMVVDFCNNLYFAGSSYATWGGPVRDYTSGQDVMVTKLDSSGYLFEPVPEINIQGNNTDISDGDDKPSTDDHTDFGSAELTAGSVTRTFTIKNSGTYKLKVPGLTLVTISGTNAGDFSVKTQPSSPVAAAGSATFDIEFNPSSTGDRTAVISIANSDADENPYDFYIQGKGTAVLTVSGITAEDKEYDATTTVVLKTSSAELKGIVGSDAVTLNKAAISGVFESKNAGTNKTVTISGLTLDGKDAGNYSLTQPTTTANITPKSITVSAAGVSKEYDGTDTAKVDFSDNRIAGDTLSDSCTAAAFSVKNAGNSLTVNVSGISISGTDSGNYTLSNTTTTTTANITAKGLTVSGITANNKVYDGTTSAVLDFTSHSLNGVIGTDDVTLDTSAYSAAFADKYVGTGKPVTVSGLGLKGSQAGNYTLTQPTGMYAEVLPVVSSVQTSTFSGTAYFSSNFGILTDLNALSELLLPYMGRPYYDYPQGFFSFNITGLDRGQTATVTARFPSSVPAGTVWAKLIGNKWSTLPIGDDDGDNIITFQVTDGGAGDADGEANCTIVEPGGPGTPKQAVPHPGSIGGELTAVDKLAVVKLWMLPVFLLGIVGTGLIIWRRKEENK
jgi:hypothetical protein